MSKQSIFGGKYVVSGGDQDTQDLLSLLLQNRGIEIENKQDFLHPKWETNHDPMSMHNMQQVCDRVIRAVNENQKIKIFSDFDADGVPGAVILSDLFDKIGCKNYSVYIPNRNTEGFGLNSQACEQFIDEGVDLLITIDCGIANLSEIRQLQSAGVAVVVTDHHLPSVDGVPDCLILDPKQADCNYPCQDLCGSGVIFKLVQAVLLKQDQIVTLEKTIPTGWEKWLLDMVGVATICDMVPLVGENRIFAYYGLEVLRKSRRVGLQTLLQLGRVNQSQLTVQDVGFTIGPRINAASRLGDPMVAYRALSGTGNVAVQAAQDLDQLNKRRKSVVAAAARAAYKKIDALEKCDVIVVGDTQWPLGIVGLIAGSVADKYNKPAFVWTRVGDQYKGSVRSGGSCSINQLMQSADETTFVSFGGHDAAGGFVCDESQIHKLSERLEQAWTVCPAYDLPAKTIDAIISVDDVHKDNWDMIRNLEPYGLGNPTPLFGLEDVEISGVRYFGSSAQHLSLSFKNSRGWNINAIRFNYVSLSERLGDLEQGDKVSLVVAMEMNTYNGASELRLRIEDVL